MNPNNKLVSIITPCYNGENYISRFIECILSQTYNNIELILINDGSTDKTYDIIKNYIDNCINLLYRLEIIDIPEDYQVIEKDNQRYIVIDELEEFDTTKAIREKYNLKCLSRR